MSNSDDPQLEEWLQLERRGPHPHPLGEMLSRLKSLCWLLGLAVLGTCALGPSTLTRHSDGSSETLEQLLGKVVVLSFWAEWCKPCVAEFPVVRAAVESAGPDVELLVVYYRGDPGNDSAAYRFLVTQPELAHLVWWPSASVLDRFHVRSLPRTLVLGRDGNVVKDFDGAILGDRATELRGALTRAVAAPMTPAPQKL